MRYRKKIFSKKDWQKRERGKIAPALERNYADIGNLIVEVAVQAIAVEGVVVENS